MPFETDQEIRQLQEKYKSLENIVCEKLKQLKDPDHSLIYFTHRIKTLDSVKEKMNRKPEHYKSIYDLYDILGVRVICYFSEDVDAVAEKIQKLFTVDRNRSKDKRKLIDAKSFGYLSLHYVCALPEEDGDYRDLWFEIQIRTVLQHCWAEIEHDLGYKTDIEVPREIRRSFSRAACLLETTDNLFSDIRNELEEYEDKVRAEIEKNRLEEVFFDRISLTEFTAQNEVYLKLLHEIAGITKANISNVGISEEHIESLLYQIDFLGIHTLKELEEAILGQHDLTMELAKQTLEGSELDELSPTAAYHYLFRAVLISGSFSRERIREFFMLSTKNEGSIENYTEKVMLERQRIKGEQDDMVSNGKGGNNE